MKTKKTYTFSDETLRKLKEIEEKTLLKPNMIVEDAISRYLDMIEQNNYDLRKLSFVK
jgi:predicted transcriptional regulator